MGKNRILPFLFAASFSIGMIYGQPALASENTDAFIGKLSSSCKNRVLEQFGVPESDISIRLGATLLQEIDSGTLTVKDLKEYGASFNWSVSGKNASGYCNVNGKSEIVEFKQW